MPGQNLPCQRGLVLALALITAAATSFAADGSWNVDTDGTWSTPGNWLGNVIASGAGSTAWFTNDITAARTITLSAAQTNGNLTFSDGDAVSTPGGWILSGSGLTLTNSAATPIISVDPINNGDATNDVKITAAITSLQGFVKKGLGTLTLGAANTFSNSVQLNEGVVFPMNASSISTGNRAVVFNGGGVRVALGLPAFTFTNQVVTTATIISSNGNYDAYNGPFTGSGTVNLRISTRFTTGGAMTGFNGTIDMTGSSSAGIWRIGTAFNLSTVALNLGSTSGRAQPTFTIASQNVLLGSLSGGPGSLLLGTDKNSTLANWNIGLLNTSTVFDGRLRDNGTANGRILALTKVGTGTLTLTAINDYTGNTTISNGVLALSGTGAISVSTNITVVSPGVLDVSALTTAWSPATAAQTLFGNGVVTGAVAMTTGTISPGFSGSIGTLSFSNNVSIDGTSGTATNLLKLSSGANDQLRIAGDLTLNGSIALRVVPLGASIPNGIYPLYQWSGNLTGDTNNLILEYPAQPGTFTLSTNLVNKQILLTVSGVAGAADLVWRGDGSLNAWDITTANWRNGANPSVFVNGDKVMFNDSGSNNVPVDISVNVNPGAVLVNATKPYTIGSTASSSIAGTISLVKSNAGTLTISSDNSYSGGTLIAGGRLQVGDGANASGTLGSGEITNLATLVYNRPDTVTVAPVISGPGGVVQQGSGTLSFNSASSYSGGTTVSNGVVRLTAYTALGSGPVTLAGGNLTLASGGNATTGLSNAVNVAADSTLQYDATGTYAAVVIGALSGTAGKTLTVSHAGSGPDRLRLYGNFTNDANLDLSGAGIALAPYHGTGNQVYNGVISGVGALLQRGGGTTYLNGDNTYSGGTTNTNGRLSFGTNSTSSGGSVVSGPLGTGPLVLANEVPGTGGAGAVEASGGLRTVENPIFYPITNAFTFIIGGSNNLTLSGPFSLHGSSDGFGGVNRTIQVDNTAASVLSGIISDNGLACGLTKTGSGLLLLNGANTYSGTTTVSNGMLGGTGSIAGPVVVASGGTLAPGASIGTLTINNDLTVNGNLAIEVNKSVSPSNDVVMVSGALSNGGTGTLTVTNLGPALVVGDAFVLFNKPMANGGALNVVGGGVTWTNKLALNGSIEVIPTFTTASYPTNISYSVGGGVLTMTWPATHLGWILQNQTNALSVGLTTPTNTWQDVSGSGSTTQQVINVNAANPTVFYRLRHP